MRYEEFKAQVLSDEEARIEYDRLEPEYQIVREMIMAREESGMTQQQLSEATGINRSDISKLENGSANPSLRTMKRIAEGLGKTLEIRFA